MNCNTKTMLKTAGGLGLLATVAYFTLPAAQDFLVASAPILLLLICPLSMFFMMKSMNSMNTKTKDAGDASDKSMAAPEKQATPIPAKLIDRNFG